MVLAGFYVSRNQFRAEPYSEKTEVCCFVIDKTSGQYVLLILFFSLNQKNLQAQAPAQKL